MADGVLQGFDGLLAMWRPLAQWQIDARLKQRQGRLGRVRVQAKSDEQGRV